MPSFIRNFADCLSGIPAGSDLFAAFIIMGAAIAAATNFLRFNFSLPLSVNCGERLAGPVKILMFLVRQ
jgi:hypothetical protein